MMNYAKAPEDGAEAEEKVLPLEKDESKNLSLL